MRKMNRDISDARPDITHQVILSGSYAMHLNPHDRVLKFGHSACLHCLTLQSTKPANSKSTFILRRVSSLKCRHQCGSHEHSSVSLVSWFSSYIACPSDRRTHTRSCCASSPVRSPSICHRIVAKSHSASTPPWFAYEIMLRLSTRKKAYACLWVLWLRALTLLPIRWLMRRSPSAIGHSLPASRAANSVMPRKTCGTSCEVDITVLCHTNSAPDLQTFYIREPSGAQEAV